MLFRSEAATDNRNRTLPEIKTALVKNGGQIADSGSVMFQFMRRGVIRVDSTGEEALLTVLDAGAEDANEEENEIIVYTNQKDLAKVRQSIIDAGLKVIEAELQYIANNEVEINDPEVARKMIKLMDVLDEVDDIVNVYTNADITVEV